MQPANIETPVAERRIVGKRILLVDDERLVRESIGRLLSRDEHTVVEVNNGVEALALFRRGQFDLVLTDYEIPFMKGSELAARIKQMAPAQPILMITGYRKLRGPDNPVDAVLNKPVDLDQLRAAMAQVLAEDEESFTA
jgi:two-component system cell cycle sensor histidine kinase/response regulator CckA